MRPPVIIVDNYGEGPTSYTCTCSCQQICQCWDNDVFQHFCLGAPPLFHLQIKHCMVMVDNVQCSGQSGGQLPN